MTMTTPGRSSSVCVNRSDLTGNKHARGFLMKGFKLLVLAGLLLSSATVWAEIRIAIVDLNGAVMKSDEARLRAEKPKSRLGPEEADGIALRHPIQKLEEKRQKDAAVMGQDELRRLQKEIDDKKIELNFKGQKLQQKGKDASQELQAVMGHKVEQAMKSIIEEKKNEIDRQS